MNLPKVLLKFIRETFKVAALKCIKPSISKTIKEMQSFLELSKVVLARLPQNSCFKAKVSSLRGASLQTFYD